MLLQAEAVGLAGLSLVLAGPVSAALARAQWPARSPRAALVLWQAVGLAGGLGVLTAGLTLAAGSLEEHWLAGVAALPARWPELDGWGWSGLAVTACVGVWLVGVTVASAARITRARRVHRRRLELIAGARRMAGVGGGEVFLVDHPSPAAYCLPGVRPRVVVTRGALATLSAAQLAAVLAHERAHATGRHDLVVQPFIAWAHTLPFLPAARGALRAVGVLVEMHADDLALRECPPEDLAAALRQIRHSRGLVGPDGDEVAAAGGSDGAPGDVGGPGGLASRTEERLARLAGAAAPLSAAAVLGIYVAAAALVVGPPVTLLLS